MMQVEALTPDSWIENLLYVAKAYIAMKQTDKAVPYLKKATSLSSQDPDELVCLEEAQKLLAKYAK
jgi:predicted Zn-dependent protease